MPRVKRIIPSTREAAQSRGNPFVPSFIGRRGWLDKEPPHHYASTDDLADAFEQMATGESDDYWRAMMDAIAVMGRLKASVQ